MGGNAFQNTRRLTPTEHAATVEKVIWAVQEFQPDIRVAAPPALPDKDSHGDVDITIAYDPSKKSGGNPEQIAEAVALVVGDKDSGDIIGRHVMFHILTKERFQIDLKFVNPRNFDMSVAVASHGQFIHLLGMILKRQALSVTKNGLQIALAQTREQKERGKQKEKKHLIAEPILTTDPAKIAEFFGFPATVFDGITRFSSEQIIDMVMECKFFDIRQFGKLASRVDLIQKPIFRTLLERIRSLDENGYQTYCRIVTGEKKAGRCAAQAFGANFDEIKDHLGRKEDASLARQQLRKRLHNGVLIKFVPELRQHTDILNDMLAILAQTPEVVGAKGGWNELVWW